jgi:hypothetical protein
MKLEKDRIVWKVWKFARNMTPGHGEVKRARIGVRAGVNSNRKAPRVAFDSPISCVRQRKKMTPDQKS